MLASTTTGETANVDFKHQLRVVVQWCECVPPSHIRAISAVRWPVDEAIKRRELIVAHNRAYSKGHCKCVPTRLQFFFLNLIFIIRLEENHAPVLHKWSFEVHWIVEFVCDTIYGSSAFNCAKITDWPEIPTHHYVKGL